MWHLLNFLAPAAGLGLFASLLAKLFWRKTLRGIRWWRLGVAASAAATLALIGGAAIGGRDGRMSTYAAMVLASALGLWWAGFRPRRGG